MEPRKHHLTWIWADEDLHLYQTTDDTLIYPVPHGGLPRSLEDKLFRVDERSTMVLEKVRILPEMITQLQQNVIHFQGQENRAKTGPKRFLILSTMHSAVNQSTSPVSAASAAIPKAQWVTHSMTRSAIAMLMGLNSKIAKCPAHCLMLIRNQENIRPEIILPDKSMPIIAMVLVHRASPPFTLTSSIQ